MPVVVKVILVGSVAHRIIQMAKGIKGAAQVSDTHQGGFKEILKAGHLAPLVPVFRVIWVHALYKMAGSDDEIKGIPVALYKVLQIFLKMILKSQLDSDVDADAVPVLCLEHAQGREIGWDIQDKITIAESGIVVVVVGNAHLLHAQFYGFLNLQADGGVGVTGKFSVQMAVVYHWSLSFASIAFHNNIIAENTRMARFQSFLRINSSKIRKNKKRTCHFIRN